MKSTAFFILLSLLSIVSDAQKNIHAVISASQLNYVYRGLDNPIEICVSGYQVTEIGSECTNCEIFQKTMDGKYFLRPNSENSVIIKIYSLRKKDKGKQLAEHTFRVKVIPLPHIMIASEPSGATLQKLYISSSALIPTFFDFDFPVYVTIMHFNISFEFNGKHFSSFMYGNRIRNSMADTLNQLPPGTRIDYEKITLKMPDASIRETNAHYFLK